MKACRKGLKMDPADERATGDKRHVQRWVEATGPHHLDEPGQAGLRVDISQSLNGQRADPLKSEIERRTAIARLGDWQRGDGQMGGGRIDSSDFSAKVRTPIATTSRSRAADSKPAA